MDQHKNKIALIFPVTAVLLLAPLQSQAKGGSELMELAYENIIFVLAGIVILAVLITIINMVFNFIELQKLRIQQEMGIEKEEVVKTLKIPTWKKINDWMWNLVPKDKEKTIDLGHSYDGIRELDNKLPPWWLALFYGSIAFAAIYLYIYQFGPNEWSSRQEYEIAMEEAQIQKDKFLSRMANAIDEKTVAFLEDEDQLKLGEQIYTLNCAACHGPQGQGLVGPNLTDDYWIHGGSIADIFSTIKYGVPEKGMIAWSSQLKPASMQNVASYIKTLKGTNPPNPKAQEGTLYVDEALGAPMLEAEEAGSEGETNVN
jgi:cytochrome c oxidase cbb3-type subunit 3